MSECKIKIWDYSKEHENSTDVLEYILTCKEVRELRNCIIQDLKEKFSNGNSHLIYTFDFRKLQEYDKILSKCKCENLNLPGNEK